ncbi:MAG: D-sedoheptulose-7-phosphate isomerase [Solirubrobacteraceae bacterium]
MKLAQPESHPPEFALVELELQTFARLILKVDPSPVLDYVNALFAAWSGHRTVLLFGNGGSAATSSHHVTDLIKSATGDTPRPLSCIGLADNAALLTAISNDIAYPDVFVELIRAYGAPGDLAVAFTTSGTSRNIVTGLEAARASGLNAVAFTGPHTVAVAPYVQTIIACDSRDPGVIETIHDALAHIATKLLRRRVVGDFDRTAE